MRTAAAIALVLALAAAPACRSGGPIEVRVDLPGVSPFSAGSFDAIIVTDFQEDSPVEGFPAGRALSEYLAGEIDLAFTGPVTRLERAADAPAGGSGRAVVITGSVRLSTEVRKALDNKPIPADGPFKRAERGLLEVRRWTMSVEVSVLAAADGEPLFRKEYREERDYADVEKPADFAFSELSARLRARLLPILLGTTTLEKRTLLGR